MKQLIFIIFVLISTRLFSQEICNNGIDDDGDGLVDCYDVDCNGNGACSDFFYGKTAVTCSMSPTNPSFSLNTLWQSPVNVSTRSTMMVGDVDGDGTPEVVCHQNGINQLYILDGITGAVEVTINCPSIADHVDAITIGDTDDDGLGEIYVVTNDNMLRCFENNGTPKVGFTPPSTSFTQESIPGIADFNQDGIPEIYKDNRIYNSLTGALIAAGSGSTGNNPGSNGTPASMPVAADVLPSSYCANCAGLELVCGNQIYAVDITGGTLTPIANSLPGTLKDGFTSVADMDLDGQLDVVVSSNGTIYVWDPRLGIQMGNTFNIPNTTAGGRANISDYDNDGLPEIGAGGQDRYVVIDVDTATNILSQKWINTIVDGSQHTTGSVFDFDCDGRAEVVYRDENNLFIWDGATGNVNASVQCGSATRSEFPTIVDVDGDGQVNIVCACASSNGGGAGVVKAFNSSTNQWVASRKVMNQHSYFVMNVNDNLSIPVQQQNHALLPHKLNTFLGQAAVFDVNWNSTCIPLADININIDSVIYCRKTDSVLLLITTCNLGSKIINTPINVSVYNGNPLQGGQLIDTASFTNSLQADSCSHETITVPFNGTTAVFYVFANDDGTHPSTAPQTSFIECDSSNNSDSVIISLPAVSLSITGDTSICKFENTTLNISGANNYLWQPSTALNSTTNDTVIANPQSTITYTVTGTDTLNGCKNTDSITINVYQNPTAIFGSNKVCNGTSTQLTDTSTSGSGVITNWDWDFGDTNHGFLQSPLHNYDSAGLYQATLIVSTNYGCKDTVTKTVQVYYNPTAAFTSNDVCIGDSIYFSNTSTVNQSTSIASYLWLFGDNTTGSSLTNPSHYYVSSGTFSVTLLIKTADSCTHAVTNNVNVFDPPKSKFNFSNSCLNDSVVLSNISVNPTMGAIANWQWDFGDNSPIDSTTYNSHHLYNADGDYTIRLITFSSNLACADTLSDTISIYPIPTAHFITSDVCLGEPSTFQDSSFIANDTITHEYWNFGDAPAIDSTHNPTHTYSNFGSYTITLISTSSNGCSDSTAENTAVHPLPNAGFTTLNVCNGSSVNFANSSAISNNSANDTIAAYLWNFDENGATSTLQSPSHLYADTGAYHVQLGLISNFGCVDSILKTIVVNPLPVVLFKALDTIGCEPLCITFQSSSFVTNGNVSGWSWNFGDTTPISNSQDALHCYLNDSVSVPFQFSPTLTVTSDSGCTQSLTKNNYITVLPGTVASFDANPKTVLIAAPTISLTNNSINADTCIWTFGDGLSSNLLSPVSHDYADTGSYIITLIGTSVYGCKDTANQTVFVTPDFLFYVPNAFSPNDDGVNDFFTGKGIYIHEFEMLIFDRWGNLIFKTTNIDKPWDGKANNGTIAAQNDVYVYSINVTDYKSQKHTFRGVVSLIR